MIKMITAIYNNDVQVYKSFGSEFVTNQYELTGMKNIPTRFLKNNTRVRALHGVEKALNRCGKDRRLKLRIVAAITQQQAFFRGL